MNDFRTMSRGLLAAITVAVLSGTLLSGQAPSAKLPPNYKTTLDNPDVIVMKVHYGPHEFVPMHDHTAFPTVYVYLNDSGEVEIKHEGPNGVMDGRRRIPGRFAWLPGRRSGIASPILAIRLRTFCVSS